MLDERSIRNETKVGRKLQNYVKATPPVLVIPCESAVKRERLSMPMVQVEASVAFRVMSDIIYDHCAMSVSSLWYASSPFCVIKLSRKMSERQMEHFPRVGMDGSDVAGLVMVVDRRMRSMKV
jgi:hypothetical protein